MELMDKYFQSLVTNLTLIGQEAKETLTGTCSGLYGQG